MKSPYRTDENTLISLSGGRTSGLMMYKVLEEYGGKLPDHVKVCFANTGKEMPQTLDFLQKMDTEWGLRLNWLEYAGTDVKPTKENKSKGLFNVVDYDTASRKGEPFEILLETYGGMPNARARYCSGQLKIRTMHRYLKSIGWDNHYTAFIGIRADEKRRAVKIHGRYNEGQDCFCPLYVDGIIVQDVSEFWKSHTFDLELPNNNGVTDWGNCDLCFLKGQGKRLSIIRERPDLADWWIRMEEKKGDRFDRMGLEYKQAKIIATDQMSMFDTDDETIPCFCGD
jgi:3'-phosphoadenosine 5'-phosphosulfate sulfotransferase (PAPS reductase)/FAD synthetase